MCERNDELSKEIYRVFIFVRVVSCVLKVRVNEIVEQRGDEQSHLKTPSSVDHGVTHEGRISDNHFIKIYLINFAKVLMCAL